MGTVRYCPDEGQEEPSAMSQFRIAAKLPTRIRCGLTHAKMRHRGLPPADSDLFRICKPAGYFCRSLSFYCNIFLYIWKNIRFPSTRNLVQVYAFQWSNCITITGSIAEMYRVYIIKCIKKTDASHRFFYYKSSLRIQEPVLRRVREYMFICHRKIFSAPGFFGACPPYSPLIIIFGS